MQLYAVVGQWYSACLESKFPQGFPGSIPGDGVLYVIEPAGLIHFNS